MGGKRISNFSITLYSHYVIYISYKYQRMIPYGTFSNLSNDQINKRSLKVSFLFPPKKNIKFVSAHSVACHQIPLSCNTVTKAFCLNPVQLCSITHLYFTKAIGILQWEEDYIAILNTIPQTCQKDEILHKEISLFPSGERFEMKLFPDILRLAFSGGRWDLTLPPFLKSMFYLITV